MNDSPLQPMPQRQPPAARGGLRLGSLFGIEVRLDASLIIIFALIIYLLGGSVFPQWHPEWPAATTWLWEEAEGYHQYHHRG